MTAAFRYDQFCPLARAAEVLGHRWSLLVLRELLLGPQRFADLKRRLAGVSTSVLAARLAELEAHGVIERRQLPPPAAREVYALSALGVELRPVLMSLARWGLHFLTTPRRGDHIEPEWVRLAAEMFAAQGPTPARVFELHARARGSSPEARFRVAGGAAGTRIADDAARVDASVSAPAATLLGLMSGAVRASDLASARHASLSGDLAALAELPALFSMSPAPNPSSLGSTP
ncbi:MAG: helix-turn-helix transcriptional regulator [Deltaproteobacteria bacterium]|nr:helix-turn-helix transcriptional regulator [Deltaproteobacteria bacterium]